MGVYDGDAATFKTNATFDDHYGVGNRRGIRQNGAFERYVLLFVLRRGAFRDSFSTRAAWSGRVPLLVVEGSAQRSLPHRRP